MGEVVPGGRGRLGGICNDSPVALFCYCPLDRTRSDSEGATVPSLVTGSLKDAIRDLHPSVRIQLLRSLGPKNLTRYCTAK